MHCIKKSLDNPYLKFFFVADAPVNNPAVAMNLEHFFGKKGVRVGRCTSKERIILNENSNPSTSFIGCQLKIARLMGVPEAETFRF